MNTDAVSPYYRVIPQPILNGLQHYAERHVETGSFLRAVLENDLMAAVVGADEESRRVLLQICHYVYNELPGNCWGSKEAVRLWLKKPLGEQGDGMLRLRKVAE